MDKTISPEQTARAKRVWALRQLTGLSRRDFAKEFGIAAGTLQNWEDPNGNGLSEKGAYRICRALKNSGVYCSVEWLMHGIGDQPQADTKLPVMPHLDNELSSDYDQTALKAELRLFCTHYPESIFFQIPDDSMLPEYNQGEQVAGIRYYNADISHLIGQDCIVLLSTGEQLFRRLRHSTIPGLYDLIALNNETKISRPYYYEVNLVYAAPVLWWRRKRIM